MPTFAVAPVPDEPQPGFSTLGFPASPPRANRPSFECPGEDPGLAIRSRQPERRSSTTEGVRCFPQGPQTDQFSIRRVAEVNAFANERPGRSAGATEENRKPKTSEADVYPPGGLAWKSLGLLPGSRVPHQ